MKNLIFVVFVFVLGCEIGVNWVEADEDGLVYFCVYNGYKYDCGTGFFISESEIITNEHVIDGRDMSAENPFRIFLGKGETNEIYDVAEIRVDEKKDLALVTLATTRSKVWFDMCDHTAELWDEIFIAAYNDGILTLEGGIVKRTNFYDGWLKTTANAEMGQSGAPILDPEDVCVLGVLKGGMLKSSYGPGVDLLREFIGDVSLGSGSSNNIVYRVR